MQAAIERDTYLRHAIGLVILLMALSDILQTRVLLVACSVLSLVIFVFSFPIKDKNLFSRAMLFILVLLLTSIVNLFFTKNNFGGSLTLLGNLFLSYLYLEYNNKQLTGWVLGGYLVTIIFISYHLFVLGTHENLIYPGLSRNHAGFAVLFYTIFLLFHLKVNYNLVSILPAVIALVLSFFLVGRTSLIVSSLLLVVVFFYQFNNNRFFLAIASFVLLGVCYLLWTKFGTELLTQTNLDAGLDTPRWKLWEIYWEHLDGQNLFTGVDVTTLPMYDQYSGNPHNSFIKFHSRVGVGSFVLIALFFVSLFKYLKLRQYYIFWLLILLAIRASFDGDMLIGNFDFIFLIITFYWVKMERYDDIYCNSSL